MFTIGINTDEIAPDKRLHLLNIVKGCRIYMSLNSSAVLKDDAVLKWSLKNLSMNEVFLMVCGRSKETLERVIDAYREAAGDKPYMLKELQKNLARAMSCRTPDNPQDDDWLNFLLKQDRGGYTSSHLLFHAAEYGHTALLKHLLEADSATKTVPERWLYEGEEYSLQGTLWRCLYYAKEQDETYNYLKSKLETYPPSTGWGALENELSDLLEFIYSVNDKPTPRLIEIVRLLRKQGAQLRGVSMERVKSEYMKKALLDTKRLPPRTIMITGAVIGSQEMFSDGLRQLTKKAGKNQDEAHQAVAQCLSYACSLVDKNEEILAFLMKQESGPYGSMEALMRAQNLEQVKQLIEEQAPKTFYSLSLPCNTLSLREALVNRLTYRNIDEQVINYIAEKLKQLPAVSEKGNPQGWFSKWLYDIVSKQSHHFRKGTNGQWLEGHIKTARLLLEQGAQTTCELGNCFDFYFIPHEMMNVLLEAQKSQQAKPSQKKK